jgi:drug/metabolite transporter (DMT)-like permease
MLFGKLKNSSKGAVASLLVALIALSFAAIFIKLSEEEMSAVSTVFSRLWISAILLAGWNSRDCIVSRLGVNDTSNEEVKSLKRFPEAIDILPLILVGIIGTASVLCWAWSLTQTSVANSTLMRNLSPLFTCILSWLFFQQQFDTRFISGMFLSLFGASLIGISDIQIGLEHLKGDALGLLAALFYSLNLLILEYLRPKFSAVTLLFWRCSIGTVVLLPIIWLTENSFFPQSSREWIIVFALAIICQCFGQSMLVHNLKYFSSSFIAIFLLIEPTLTAIFACWIFAETLSVFNSFGFIIVLIGIFLARNSQSSDRKALMEERAT